MSDESVYEAWDLEALADIPNYQEWIVSAFRPYLRGEAVEIGAGTGTISRRLLPHVTRLELVEPAPNLVADLRNAFAGDGKVTIVAKTIEAYLADAPPASRDAAALVNVLEHLEDDAGAMAGLIRLLRPGGHLLIFVPALPRLFSAMDVALGHHRRYGLDELVRLAADAGFGVVSARYFDLLGVLPWWILHTLGRRTRFDPGLSRIYDRFVVPMGRGLERLFRPPVGKNLLLVAKRPAANGLSDRNPAP